MKNKRYTIFFPFDEFKKKSTNFFLDRRLRLAIIVLGAALVTAGLIHTNVLIKKISRDEREKISVWAKATQHKATLVHSVDSFFSDIQSEERFKMELYAKMLMNHEIYGKYYQKDLYKDIVERNNNIPIIITDKNGKFISSKNITLDSVILSKNKNLDSYLYENFTKYPPIPVNSEKDIPHYIYYQDSHIFKNVKEAVNDIVNSFLNDVSHNSLSVPVIITDSSRKNILSYGHLDSSIFRNKAEVEKLLHAMQNQNDPIKINLKRHESQYIYYKDSFILSRLKRFPYIQLVGIFFFAGAVYLILMAERRNEQNKLWAGLAKETAHQLGTPISSLMAWTGYIERGNVSQEMVENIKKDIERLAKVAERFSKIGSSPTLIPEDLTTIIYNSIDYLKKRLSSKISFIININKHEPLILPLNKQLFDWVIENLVKNAIDAMPEQGIITIDLEDNEDVIFIDITDTGKGIPRYMQRKIFKPGFSTKKLGWGLGLSLSKRIVEEYHNGKLFVKNSTPGKGTTFRIELKKTLN